MNQRWFCDLIRKKILVIDGAMGTTVMQAGVSLDQGFEGLNFLHPDLIVSIHRGYLEAGANLIETNTFGGNRIKLSEYGAGDRVKEVNARAVELARKAIALARREAESACATESHAIPRPQVQPDIFVVGSIGPIGKLMQPMGEMTFDEALDVFAEQARALRDGGADILCIETISDLQEMRAALLAAKKFTNLPVICSLTFDENGKTITGTSPEAAVFLLERLGADAIAANCSTGPEQMVLLSRRLVACATNPIMIMPNAGQPDLVEGRAVYKMTPEKFASYIDQILQNGVSLVGGCCGTTKEHIRAVRNLVDKKYSETSGFKPAQISGIKFSSRTRLVAAEKTPVVVGEKINPTGRKLFQEELRTGIFTRVRKDAMSQEKAGAHLLDINMGVPDTNEAGLMEQAVRIVQNAASTPLSIDSTNLVALEAGLKNFVGIPLINSVNGEAKSLANVLPLAKKYGAKVIALLLDEAGVPDNIKDKARIAEKIVAAADREGIARDDLFIDGLVMTVGVSLPPALETLKLISFVKERFLVRTILGVSNVSHGMPEREKLNAYYLMLALLEGLDAALIDPLSAETQKVIQLFQKAKPHEYFGLKERYQKMFVDLAEEWKKMYKKVKRPEDAALSEKEKIALPDVAQAVIEGDRETVKNYVQKLLDKNEPPQKIIEEGLIRGMETVGKWFSSGKYFLPQVVAAAEAMQGGFELCKARLSPESLHSAGTIILATVKGDVHDIGKNIVKMLLENHGFKVIDLGKDVDKETIVEAALKHQAAAVALSALLTTTMVQMEAVSQELKAKGLNIPVMVGGAVVNQAYADKIGAVFGHDALDSVKVAKEIIQKIR